MKGRGERDVDMARYFDLLPPLLPPLLISMAPARPATIPPALGPNRRQRRRCLSLPGPVLRFCSSSLSPSLPFLPRRWLPIRSNDSSATTHTRRADLPPLPLHRPPISLPLKPAMNVMWRSWPSPCLCPTPSSTTPKGGSVLFFPHGGETFLVFSFRIITLTQTRTPKHRRVVT